MFTLVDDGTLDTVLECDECHTQLRYNLSGTWNRDPPLDDHEANCGDNCECQDAVAEQAQMDAKETHECPR